MADKTSIKQKEIQIQRPAQSLTAFQRKVSSGIIDERSNLIKQIMIVGAALIVAIAALVSWKMWRSHKIEQHETAMSALIAEVGGSLADPVPAEEKEQRMRNALPRLEELASKAPRACRDVANGFLSTWKLELNGKGGELPALGDPWSRLCLAQRSIYLGEAKEASGIISVLHKDAKPNRAWSRLYWSALLQIRQLEGNREQALKDFAEYRRIFKDRADLSEMEKILNAT